MVRLAMASAGKMTDAPASGSALMFSRTSEPQSADGGWMPRPRKLRLASSSTT